MISVEEVKKLATLARIEVSDSEIEKLRGDLNSILSYVDQLKEVDIGKHEIRNPKSETNINIMRNDQNPHPPVESLGYFKVKKIIDYDA